VDVGLGNTRDASEVAFGDLSIADPVAQHLDKTNLQFSE
jgi:hypothetical protein